MSSRLLVTLTLLAACKSSSISLPKPTATTAFISAATNDTGTLEAVDVSSRSVSDVLPSATFEAYALVKTYAHNLYVVGDFPANMLVLEPDNAYKPACAAGSITACQFKFPDGFDPIDFVVTDATHMYVTTDLSSDPSGAPGSVSNSVHVFNPLSGTQTTSIDLAAGAKALAAADGGEDLLAVVGDGTIDLTAMYQVDNLLFVVAQMLVTGAPDPVSGFSPRAPKATSDACGFEPSRVIVVDLNRNAVAKVIKLRGANTQGPFVVEHGTDNLLLASTGAIANFDQEPCNGIERVDAVALTSKGTALSEAQMSSGVAHSGTVFAFDLDDLGDGFAFVGSGSSANPDYNLVRFNIDKGVLAQVQDAGVKGISYFGFVAVNKQRQAYVSLPYADTPAIATYDAETGTLLQTVTLKLGAFQLAFYPGPDFIKL